MNILITGATSGIGRHAALHLARSGHRVIATGRRMPLLDSLRAEAASADLHTLRLDVTDPASIDAALARTREILGPSNLDVLINNAGYPMTGPLELITDAELREQFDVNVFGLMNVTRAVVPAMRERGQGMIINISSVSGRVAFPFMGPYVASKFAVEALSDSLRMELHPFGIKVVIIEPGPIRTNISAVASARVERFRQSKVYARAMRKGEEILRDFDRKGAEPAVVSKLIERILRKRRPRPRYIVPAGNRLSVWLLTKLPTRWADALKLAAFDHR
jgi:NAD(P)-dependent dehydrogenase (short-subunit alcohol dehydrogenase family)